MIGRNLFLLSTPVARMFLITRWVSRRKDVKQLSINILKLKVKVKHSTSRRRRFSPNPLKQRRQPVFLSFHLSELNYIAISLCNKDPEFIFLLNLLFIYLLPTAMRSVAENYTIDLFYLFKGNFKNLLFDSLITGRSLGNLSYFSGWLLSQRWRFQRIRSNVLRGSESDLAYTKILGVLSQYILRSESFWHPLSSSKFFHW